MPEGSDHAQYDRWLENKGREKKWELRITAVHGACRSRASDEVSLFTSEPFDDHDPLEVKDDSIFYCECGIPEPWRIVREHTDDYPQVFEVKK